MLDFKDFNPDKQRIRFRRLKGSIGGEWPLHPREVTALRTWVKVRGKNPGPLFPSRNNRAIGRFQVLHLMKAYCALAGIAPDKAHTHALKHSIAMTLRNEKHKDLKFIQSWLGHKNMNSTAQYLHLSDLERDNEAKDLYQDW
jgi:integrase